MENKKAPVKIVIIGGGFVGASTAFALTMAWTVAEIVIVDTNRDKAKGEALDINHGLSMIKQQNIHDGGYEDVRNADIIIVTAGSARKPGETRLQLAQKNVGIASSITKSIMQHYNGGIILVVSNPVDILTQVIWKQSGLPKSRVFGSGTSLDTSRLRYTLGEYYNIDVTKVNSFIIGEHGDSMVPVWSNSSIAGIPLEIFDKMSDKKLDKKYIEEEVRNCGAKIIQLKGATYYAIAMSVSRIVEAIIKDQRSVMTVGSVLSGQYGVEDIAISLPCIVGANGIEQVLEIDLTEQERKGFAGSASKIREVLNSTVV